MVMWLRFLILDTFNFRVDVRNKGIGENFITVLEVESREWPHIRFWYVVVLFDCVSFSILFILIIDGVLRMILDVEWVSRKNRSFTFVDMPVRFLTC